MIIILLLTFHCYLPAGYRGTNPLGSLYITAPPPMDETGSESPWSFIQSLSKPQSGSRTTSQRGRGGGSGRDKLRQFEHYCPHSHYHRGSKPHSRHSKRFTNPLAKVLHLKHDPNRKMPPLHVSQLKELFILLSCVFSYIQIIIVP